MVNQAQVEYRPLRPSPSAPVKQACASLQAALKSSEGVIGFGVTRDTLGDLAIAVYVRDQESLRVLPTSHQGFSVVGLIAGEVDALAVG